MSYNINTHEIVHWKNLRISRASLRKFFADMREAKDPDMQSLPELNPFDDLRRSVVFRDDDLWKVADGDDQDIALKNLSWGGEWSGHSYELLKDLLRRTLGEADVIYTWEGGDSFSGLRVRDGVVTEHEVTWAIGKEVRR
jgi:hypothetical protein